MAQIIFAVEKPNTDIYQNEQKWRAVTANLSALDSKNTDIQLLGENVLLISLDNNLNGLADVTREILGLGYKYQVLSENIMWTEVASKA